MTRGIQVHIIKGYAVYEPLSRDVIVKLETDTIIKMSGGTCMLSEAVQKRHGPAFVQVTDI